MLPDPPARKSAASNTAPDGDSAGTFTLGPKTMSWSSMIDWAIPFRSAVYPWFQVYVVRSTP